MIHTPHNLIPLLQRTLQDFGFKGVLSVVNDINKKTESHRFVFTDDIIKVSIELKRN